MVNKIYCPVCKQEVEFKIKKSLIKEYKGVQVNVEENIPYCSKCGIELFVPEIENDNLKRLYRRYGELTGLITPEDIAKIRKKYNLSQRELGQILGWGKMTINRYERGALPSVSHSDILKLISKSKDFLIEKAKEALREGRISEKTYQKIQKTDKPHITDLRRKVIETELNQPENVFNGFKKFDFEKLENLISYIADKVDNLYLSSLNKYFWYIDFLHFKRHSYSVTGLSYIKYAFGPVIKGFVFNEIAAYPSNKYYVEEYEMEDGAIQTKFKSKRNYDLTIFTTDELQTIDTVINALKDKTCKSISELSHNEAGWQQTPYSELISYEYAEQLKLFT